MTHKYLERNPNRDGWLIRGDEVDGQLVWTQRGEPYSVVVDGLTLTWEELGLALEPFEGFRFRLVLEDATET